MTNKENLLNNITTNLLANMLAKEVDCCSYCIYKYKDNKCKNSSCVDGITIWLKSEAITDTNDSYCDFPCIDCLDYMYYGDIHCADCARYNEYSIKGAEDNDS